MSANVDLVRSIYGAVGRGDFRSAALSAHPEIEYVVVDGPLPGTWIGVPEMAQAYGDFLDAWDEHRNEAEEYRELDGERILVLTRIVGRGKTSGLPISTGGANVFYGRGGKVTRLVTYWDRDRAFADLGMEE